MFGELEHLVIMGLFGGLGSWNTGWVWCDSQVVWEEEVVISCGTVWCCCCLSVSETFGLPGVLYVAVVSQYCYCHSFMVLVGGQIVFCHLCCLSFVGGLVYCGSFFLGCEGCSGSMIYWIEYC